MNPIRLRVAAFLLTLFPVPALAAQDDLSTILLDSPNGDVRITFNLDPARRPSFTLEFRGRPVAAATLGLDFLEGGPLQSGLEIVATRRSTHDETYTIPVGKTSSARDHHHELIVSLRETSPPQRLLDIAFRAFDDGAAFRYLLPAQPPLADFTLTDELTQLTFPDDPSARLLPLNGYTTSYEQYYKTSSLSQVDPKTLIGLPLLLQLPRDAAPPAWLAVTEANLTDYAGMYLAPVEGQPGTLVSRLSPLPGRADGAKVVGHAPHPSPWRLFMIADDPGRLLESNLVFHLSDPPAFADTSWIVPGKTTFPWWNGYALDGVDFESGVNTATMKYYIDFCAEQGIPYHSLDGLDIAWYGGPIAPVGPTDITKAAPSIDLPELLRHAKQKNVRLRLWLHWKALQPQIDEAFARYEEWGIEGVMVDFMDRDDQEMVRFYHEMASKAAKHHLTLTLHGAYKPTGLERTWPNVLTYEAALNQEYDKWDASGSRGTPPEHNLDIAFIRMLAGPLDYHQGGMRNVLPLDYHPRYVAPPVQGTRGHQLAMYIVYQNHLPMMADQPASYRGQPELPFLVDIPCTWDETRVLHAEPGRCLVLARRRGTSWYLGGMTASEPRELTVPLDFLPAGPHLAELHVDDPASGPTSTTRLDRHLDSTHTLRLSLPPSGGFAGRVSPAPRGTDRP